jgi:CDP-diacylglycerol pyrophosphatase
MAGKLARGPAVWLAALAIVAAAALVKARAADPSALWHIVHDKCVPHEQTDHDPSPCAEVDLSEGVDRGYAVLKDLVGRAQFLLIPTARMRGIESPEVLDPNGPNYWDDAWKAHYFVEDRVQAPLARNDIALAINSAFGRTQDQLHIHIDCVRPDVKAALAAHQGAVGPVWTRFPVPLAGYHYRAVRVEAEFLGRVNPFRLLADSDPRIAADMGDHTLAVIGMSFANGNPGFIILDGKVNLAAGDRGSAETLQDHACAVAGNQE